MSEPLKLCVMGINLEIDGGTIWAASMMNAEGFFLGDLYHDAAVELVRRIMAETGVTVSDLGSSDD